MDTCLEDEDYCRYVQMLMADKAAIMEDETDCDYEFFLNHLREQGKSYVFETIVTSSGLPVSVKYESSCDEFHDTELKFRRNIERTYSGAVTRSKHQPNLEPTSLNSEMGRQESINKATPSKRKFNDLMGKPLVDSSYQYFLKKARMHGSSIILELGNNVSIQYESIRESVTMSTRPSKECTVRCKNEQLVDARSFGNYCDDSSSFSKRLMAVLSKPYSKHEYNELMREVSCCKSVLRRKDLRNNRDITYETGRQGKSYLDHYPDLAKKLKVADHAKALGLLRGFFFWLQNLCYEGAFKPWLRSSDHNTCTV